MKKGDKVATISKKRDWYDTTYVPLTRGEITKVTGTYIEITWYDAPGRPTQYPIDKVIEKGNKKKHTNNEEYNHIEIVKERK